MKTIRYRSTGNDVYFLEDLLTKLGYQLYVSYYFGLDTHAAVKDFQRKNNLVIDGIVGLKTWSKLIATEQEFLNYNKKLLSENDLVTFATIYNLELAAVKAVNEIESSGKGFLADGRPKILFEGHVFWKELIKRDVDPNNLLDDNSKDVLYSKWTKKYYLGGIQEYTRLEKAANLSTAPGVHDAAYCSASWGAFQIMGYRFDSLGYKNINEFVIKMNEHEREHLFAFGKFLEANNLLTHLKNKDWAKFARGYNGPAYKLNKYDIKLEKAYKKYSI